jgi:hypothetical protein
MKIELTAMILVVALVGALLLFNGFTTRRPLGQRGLKGTWLENSRGLWAMQMIALAILQLACFLGLAWVWFRA